MSTPRTAKITYFGDLFFDSDKADYVEFTGLRIPVPALLTSPPAIVKIWDKRGGVGLRGAWPFYNGEDLSEFTLQFQMANEEDVDAFHTYADPFGQHALFATKFKYKNGRVIDVEALDILYPQVNQLGITRCVVKSHGGIVKVGGGHHTCDVVFVEYKPPPPVRVAAKVDGHVAGEKDVPPKNADQIQIEILTAAVKKASEDEAAKG